MPQIAFWEGREAGYKKELANCTVVIAGMREEMGAKKSAMDNACRENAQLQHEAAELRRTKAALAANTAELESLLAESEKERKAIRHKYMSLGDKVRPA